MKIDSISIENYKGFKNSGAVRLSPKWNVLIGKNSAGKTAFMEAISMHALRNKPHRDRDRPRGELLLANSYVEADLSISRKELEWMWRASNDTLDVPVGINVSGIDHLAVNPESFFREPGDLRFTLKFSEGIVQASWPSHGIFAPGGDGRVVKYMPDPERRRISYNGPLTLMSDGLPVLIRGTMGAIIFSLHAQRYSIGSSPMADAVRLDYNAANLPASLMKMRGSRKQFDEFCANVTAIFPQIRDVEVSVVGGEFEIKLWHVEPETDRGDLAIPVNESGTGVAQVLAILHVAMVHPAGIIAIDEPNSFLHPGAAKALIQILKKYDQHQYIITTHSPEVIAAAQPAALHLVKFEDGASTVDSFNDAEVSTKRLMLEEVGASLSDVFSADRVIWVEGPTERECFDLVLKKRFPESVVGLAFLALRNTSDFDGKNADTRAALDIYDTLTKGGSILPTAVAFSFDRELKSAQEVQDLQRRCDNRARVLARRMTENYLLNPAGIAGRLNDLGESALTSAQIEALIDEHAEKHMPKHVPDKRDIDLLGDVDAARLLGDVFHFATEGRQTYGKVRDAVELLRINLDQSPEHVAELVEFVGDLIRLADVER